MYCPPNFNTKFEYETSVCKDDSKNLNNDQKAGIRMKGNSDWKMKSNILLTSGKGWDR
jgi:hypothetical protein